MLEPRFALAPVRPGRASIRPPPSGPLGFGVSERLAGDPRAARDRDGRSVAGLPRSGRSRPARPGPAAGRGPPARAPPRRPRAEPERVLVFGDFDADGLTGLAILVRALRRFGLDVEPYVPEPPGRGPRPVPSGGRTGGGGERHALIVTVDTGSSSVDEVDAANRARDRRHHHRSPSGARAACPPPYALVNPHRADSTYPDDRLAGSGVAFKVGQLLLADVPGRARRGPRPGRPRHHRHGRRRRPDPRREPGDRPARPRPPAHGAAAGLAALLARAGVAGRIGRPGDGLAS